MLINLRNALMASRRSPLPPGARWVEYLESTGTQWIDTGVKKTSGTTVDCTFSLAATNTKAIFGARTSPTDLGRLMLMAIGSYFRFDARNQPSLGIPDTTSVFRFQYDGAVATLTNLTTGTTSTSSTLIGDAGVLDISLFGVNTNGIVGSLMSGMMYAFRIYNNGVLVRDFIPVRRGTVGYLYDRVSGRLFGNAGTGDFVLGPDVVPVEWLQSDGNTYAVLPNNLFSKQDGYGVEVTLSKGTASFSAISILCAAGAGVYESPYYVRFSADGVTQLACPGAAWNNLYSDAGIHTIKMISRPYTSSTKVSASVDNGQSTEYTATTSYVFANTVGVFAANNGTNKCPAGVQVYSIRGFDASNSTLAQYIPVRVGTDATSWEGAMMDVLTRRIYRNQGTGAFGYGADLPLETLAR